MGPDRVSAWDEQSTGVRRTEYRHEMDRVPAEIAEHVLPVTQVIFPLPSRHHPTATSSVIVDNTPLYRPCCTLAGHARQSADAVVACDLFELYAMQYVE
eukprot:356939-Chlamydomonas_euryale.AAC.8